MGRFAAEQTRHIATYFPGRMAGSPAELLTADYLKQQFSKMGYQSDIRSVNTRYLYTSKDGKKNWNNVTASSVIAARNGDSPKQIVIVAHFDTYTPQSDEDLDNNLGGLTLQGVDDNASGIGVMLELAERLKSIPTAYGLRFVATSAEELGSLGAQNYLQRMSAEEKSNTVLVINLDSLITGDRLYFNAGRNTPPQMAKRSRDRALDIAHRYGIAAASNPGSTQHPKGTGCCSDQRCSMRRASRCCRWRPPTGRWATRTATSSAPSARTSRRASPGTARSMTTCSTWIATCRGGSTNAAATACRSCCR